MLTREDNNNLRVLVDIIDIDYDIARYYIVIILFFTMDSHHISQDIFDNNCLLLNIVSYNLHGINQGYLQYEILLLVITQTYFYCKSTG